MKKLGPSRTLAREIQPSRPGRPAIPGREDAVLAHVRRYPGLAAYEIGSAALGLPHSQAHHAAAPVLVRLEGRGLVRHEDEPVEGGRWPSVRRWYPAGKAAATKERSGERNYDG